MPYWGHKSADNDYASTTVGAYIILIKERMFEGAKTVLAKAHPEQGIVASIKCLRLLAEEFPQCVRIHFGRRDLQKAREDFLNWYSITKDKIPAKYREPMLADADLEFRLFEERVLGPKQA